MKRLAVSIRQPWAWLILHAGKDIENRNWQTSYRGPCLIHAAKGMTVMEYEEAAMFLTTEIPRKITLPAFDELQRGGIVGSVDITGCWVKHHSPWFVGFYGFSLANPKPLRFTPCRGQLRFFWHDDGGASMCPNCRDGVIRVTAGYTSWDMACPHCKKPSTPK